MTNAIVFDFDGVIVESADDKTEAFAALFAEFGDEVVARVVEYHKAHMGISRFEKFRHYYAELLHRELSPEKERELGERFSDLVMQKVITVPYVPGAYGAIERCSRRFPLFVASGTPEEELREIVLQRGLTKFFRGVFGSPRSKKDILLDIAATLGVPPSGILMVGDAMSDYKAAVEAGARFLGRENPHGNSLRELKGIQLVPDLKYFEEIAGL